MVWLMRLLISVTDKKKSYWNQPATKDDVFNAMVAAIVTVSLGIIIGFIFLI
jgi:hypothetical protein